MNLTEYQALAARTINPDLDREAQIVHGTVGLVKEVDEFKDAKEELRNSSTDKTCEDHRKHCLKELGDICWMIAEILTAGGYTAVRGNRILDRKMRNYVADVCDALQKHHQGHGYDWCKVFYATTHCYTWVDFQARNLGSSLEEVLQMNIDKLMTRYPNGFESEKSMNRQEGDI